MTATEPRSEPLSAGELRLDKIRKFSADKIAESLRSTEGQPDIVRLLAIGEACPYAGVAGPRAIWTAEFQRQWAEIKEVSK